MSYPAPSGRRVLAELSRTTFLRMLRAVRIAGARRAMAGRGRRQATARKGGDGLLLLVMVLVLPLMLFQATFVGSQAAGGLRARAIAVEAVGDGPVELPLHVFLELRGRSRTEAQVREVLDEFGVDEDSWPKRSEILARYRESGMHGLVADTGRSMGRVNPWSTPEPWPNESARELYVRCASLVLLGLVLAMFCVNFSAANQNLAGSSWSTSWLLTFPIPTPSLLTARLVEYSVVQVLPWIVLVPLTWQLLRKLGAPAPFALAALSGVATAFAIGALRLWIETWLRLRCSLRTLRSVQGVCSVVAVVVFLGLVGVVMRPTIPQWFVDLGQSLPAVVAWLPGSWVLAVAGHGLPSVAVGLGLSVAFVAASLLGASQLLSHGTMAGGGVDSGRSGAGRWRTRRAFGVAGKDLALLSRDRNFLAQTVVVPIVVVLFQFAINPGLDLLGDVGFGLVAYGVGMLAGLGGCMQVLIAEGKGLWMLYSLPVDLGAALRRKVGVWAALAVVFVAVAAVVLRARAGALEVLPLVHDIGLGAFGVFCAAHIAGAIGVLGSQPAAEHVSRTLKVRYVYLHLFLGGFYLIVLATPSIPVKIGGALAFATLAYGLWQRARLRLGYVLDPVSSPEPALSVLDGAMAVFVFLVVQVLCLLAFLGMSLRIDELDATRLLVSFVISGAVALLFFATVAAIQGRSLAAELGLRRPVAGRGMRAASLAAVVGVALGFAALGYAWLARRFEWFEAPDAAEGAGLGILVLAVVAAPIVEECLFRGLLFGGMRKTLPVPLAVLWSSAVFTALHPVVSWPPVFVAGLACAIAYSRSGWLVAPILLHASYNLVVVLGA